MLRALVVLVVLLLASPLAAQPITLGNDSPGLRVYGSGGGGSGIGVASGSGTTNALMKFDASDDAADSVLSDDGTNVTNTGQYITKGGAANAVAVGPEANTGLYFSAADNYTGFVTNGTEAARVTGTGVGLNFVAGWGIGFGSLTAPTSGFIDHATGVVRVNDGTTTGYGNIITAARITAGSGTGVTVNAGGFVRTLVYKVTVLSTNCVAAAVTCDLTIATLPAKTFIRRVFADLTAQYACTAVCTTSTLSATLGTSAGGAELLATMDLDAATAQFGDADAELGTSLNAAARTANGALIDGVLASWSGTTTVTLRITSGTGNLGDGAATNLSGGTLVFYITTDVHP